LVIFRVISLWDNKKARAIALRDDRQGSSGNIQGGTLWVNKYI
jgi:hypothetical protein